MLALAVLSYALERAARRAGGEAEPDRAPPGRAAAGQGRAPAVEPLTAALGALAVAIGALLFAGSLAAGGEEPWPGLPAGAICAALAFLASGWLLRRARRRLDAEPAALLPVWADAASLALAAVAIAFPPASLLGLVALAYLLLSLRRGGARKYEGLRILR